MKKDSVSRVDERQPCRRLEARLHEHMLRITPRKSNIGTKNCHVKGSYLFQTIILGIHVSFRGVLYHHPNIMFYQFSACVLVNPINLSMESARSNDILHPRKLTRPPKKGLFQ